MRKHLISIIILLSIILAMVPLAYNPIKVAASTTVTIYSSASDGVCLQFNANYTIARNAATGYNISNSLTAKIGQIRLENYYVYRAFFYFDTSGIPFDAVITDASIYLYGYTDQSDTDFNLVVQNGQPTYPHDPLLSSDYNKDNYAGNGGQLSTVGFNTLGYNVIPLNSDGKGWINKGGQTKFCIRSSRDINADTSEAGEAVDVYCSEQAGIDEDPYLSITYVVPPRLSCYSYRQLMTLSRASGAVTNYTMKLTIYKTTGTTSGSTVYLQNHALSWTGTVPNDLRFTKFDGTTELDYWIESSDSTQATVWVEFDSIETTDTYFFIYYGKAGDTTTSNGTNTFLFFDDFPGNSLDTAKWDESGAGTAVVSDGLCVLTGDKLIITDNLQDNSVIFRSRLKTNRWNTTDGMQRMGFAPDSSMAKHILGLQFAHIIAGWPRSCVQYNGANYLATLAATGDWSANTYYISELKRAGDHTEWWCNDVSKIVLGTTYYPTDNMRLLYHAYNSGDIMTIDWCLLRKYAATEPTWGTWGSEVSFVLTPPTNVAATDGTYTDKVVITWTKVAGATGYEVYEGSNRLDTLGDVNSYNDTAAPAPTITPGSTVASDGDWAAHVSLLLVGASTTQGASRSYKVKAFNDCETTNYSDSNSGYRGVGALTYQWQRSLGDSDATYSNIDGATSSTYSDTGAPAPTITPGTATSSDGSSTAYVTLSIAGESANAGAGRYYKCYLTATGATSKYSTTDRGYRGVGALTYQWYRSAGDSDASYSLLSGATTDPYNDSAAPAPTITPGTATATDGSSTSYVTLNITGESTTVGAGKYYYCNLSATGAASQNTNSDRGYRGVGSLTYQWQRSVADSDADYSNIGGATSTSYNDTAAPAPTITMGTITASDGTETVHVTLSITGESASIGDSRYFKCYLTAAGATSQNSTSDRGYRGVGVLIYQWQRSATDSDANYSNISGANSTIHNDTAAPAGTITPGSANATDGISTDYVTLTLSGHYGGAGEGRYYKCVLDAEGAAQQTSPYNRGYRGIKMLSYQWLRSAADSDENYCEIEDATATPYNDTDGVVSPDGRYYKCIVSAIDVESQNSTADRGYKSIPTLPLAPSNLMVTAVDTDSILIMWDKGYLAENTIIVVKASDNPIIDDYPANITDGMEIYSGVGENMTYIGVDLVRKVYYVRAWSENDEGYSMDYAQAKIGGDMLLLMLFGILGLGMTVAFFWKRSGFLAYGAAGMWLLLGFTAFQTSSSSSPIQITDVYMGLFWMCIGLTFTCSLLPWTTREKSLGDVASDEGEEEEEALEGEDLSEFLPKKTRKPITKTTPPKSSSTGRV